MNLKEAFRYQNKLQRLMDEAQSIVARERNVVTVENTALRHKVNPEAENETTLEPPETEYADRITQLISFMLYLLQEKERLSYAIRHAKQTLDMDFDGEISLNAKRQELAALMRHLGGIRSSEVLLPHAGTGYKFNTDGNQVTYRCDLKRVTTINFDRNKVLSYAAGLSKKADQVSAQLDSSMVNTQVDYQPPFDVNEALDGAFTWYLSQNS